MLVTVQSSAFPLDPWHCSSQAESAPHLWPMEEVKAEEGNKLVIDSC